MRQTYFLTSWSVSARERISCIHNQNCGSVSVCRCYHNKILQTWWLINNRSLFLTILESAGPRSSCGRLGEGALSDSQTCTSSDLHMTEGVKELSGENLLYKGTKPWSNHFFKTLPPNNLTFRIHFHWGIAGRHRHSVYSRWLLRKGQYGMLWRCVHVILIYSKRPEQVSPRK